MPDRANDGASESEQSRLTLARALPRSLIERFGSEPEKTVLVAPIQIVGRGHNILNRSGKAAISAIYFLHRPHPRPDDLAPTFANSSRQWTQVKITWNMKWLSFSTSPSMMRSLKRRASAVDKRVDTLHLAAWSARLTTDLVLTRFMVPRGAHDGMAEWCREKSGRAGDLPTNVVLSGLSEIASFLVPETAYMKTERDVGERGPGRLCLFFVGDVSGNEDVRRRIQASFSVWLGILYPDKAAELRSRIADTALEDASWKVLSVGTELRQHDGACAVPEDPMLYDALTVTAAGRLAGAVISFQSGQARTLVPRTPQTSPYYGVDLVAFPPNKERDGEGLWSEVITVSTATFPERKEDGVHLLVRPSIRNWGPMQGYDLSGSPTRSLDLFMPPATGREQGFAQYRHTSFRFKAVVDNWKDVYERDAYLCR